MIRLIQCYSRLNPANLPRGYSRSLVYLIKWFRYLVCSCLDDLSRSDITLLEIFILWDNQWNLWLFWHRYRRSWIYLKWISWMVGIELKCWLFHWEISTYRQLSQWILTKSNMILTSRSHNLSINHIYIQYWWIFHIVNKNGHC